jgi:rfaE bifunctional protein kinase chain/domain
MKNISLDTFKGIRILVAGDVMLDRYVRGEVSRISPEAPVPVLSVTERTDVPGGAANVAANLRGLGCSVALWGITGSDGQAGILGSLLEELRVENFLVCDRNRTTTSKTRLVADSQQIVRYDEESNEPVSSELEDRLFLSLESRISGADAVVLSD